jgi:hypothetical protein
MMQGELSPDPSRAVNRVYLLDGTVFPDASLLFPKIPWGID